MIRAWLRRAPEERPVLGRLVREAWSRGPAAPSVDALLAGIRPALARIDAEVEAAPPGLAASLRRLVSPPLYGALATGTVAIALLVFLLAPRPVSESDFATAELTPTGDPTIVQSAVPDVYEPEASMADGVPAEFESDDPVLFFESEESTLIWIVEGQDDISRVARNGAA